MEEGRADQTLERHVLPHLEDVRDRLTSVLSRWNDEAFRRPVLQTGIEEARFYQPASVELEIRALVVIAVRNSRVGDLNADVPATPGLRHALADAEMPAITGQAIRYFSQIDLAALSEYLSPPQNDVFGNLPAQYPTAWNAISHLAGLKGLEGSLLRPKPPSTRSAPRHLNWFCPPSRTCRQASPRSS